MTKKNISKKELQSKRRDFAFKYWYLPILAGAAGILVAGYILGVASAGVGFANILLSRQGDSKKLPNYKKTIVAGVFGIILGIVDIVLVQNAINNRYH